jgi:hypothetical protein
MDKFVTKRRKHEEVAVPKEVQLDGKNGQKNDVTRLESDPTEDITVNKPGKYTGSATVRDTFNVSACTVSTKPIRCGLFPKCAKIHPRASVISKNFPGVIPPTPVKMAGEGKAGEVREEREVGGTAGGLPRIPRETKRREAEGRGGDGLGEVVPHHFQIGSAADVLLFYVAQLLSF